MVPTQPDYQLDLDAIADAITPRTRAVVTVSPNNPTGVVFPEADLRAVNALCATAASFTFMTRRTSTSRTAARRTFRRDRSTAPARTRFRCFRSRRATAWRAGAWATWSRRVALGRGQQDSGHRARVSARDFAAGRRSRPLKVGPRLSARRPRATRPASSPDPGRAPAPGRAVRHAGRRTARSISSRACGRRWTR